MKIIEEKTPYTEFLPAYMVTQVELGIEKAYTQMKANHKVLPHLINQVTFLINIGFLHRSPTIGTKTFNRT
eukprot:c34641_g1_i1 orf=92-304(-)